MPKDIDIETRIAREDNAIAAGVRELGEPSSYACPECHGVLLQIKDALPLRFRCHTGHAHTFESLLADVNETIESSVWQLIRAFEEQGMLLRHVAGHLAESDRAAAERLLERAAESDRRSALAQQVALGADRPSAVVE